MEVFEDERDALGAEALDLEEFERAGREFRQQQVAALAGAAFGDLGQHLGQAFADAGNVGDLAVGVAQDIGDTLRVAFHGGGAVAIAANAEAIFGGDLHQIGGFPEDARDFLVLQTDSSIQLYRVGLDLLTLRRVVCICWLAAVYFS